MLAYINKWSYKRVIQLGIGVYFFWEYINHPSAFALILGLFMSVQAIANIGCFSTQGCSTNIAKSPKHFSENDEIEHEEIN